MEIKITNSHGMTKVVVTDGNTSIDLGWTLQGSAWSGELANMLRTVADELQPDAVPYDELVGAYEREQEREDD
ncbi:hypothetical protein [Burkholderia gladioli]|uniref:hypothetical protein n=1 Tax=Burkholderia gladioli TaxID=28095 RepID=UPI00163F4A7E|nr:hypothetical protein [Burkholderia gladioli]